MIIKLTEKELSGCCPGKTVPQHEMLRLLREKGAPVIGVIDLKPNPDYKWERFNDPITKCVVFKITRK